MTAQETPKVTRPRGRPRLDIDPDDVADAVAELFAEGGLEAVSILDTAQKLSVSRATLYRTVPTKEHLLGILFDRSTSELTKNAKTILKRVEAPDKPLVALVELQVDAAIRMRGYLPVLFDGSDLPPEIHDRWRKWSRDFERIWVNVIKDNVAAGLLDDIDPVITARLLLGSCIWVSRWYRPDEKYTPEQISAVATDLVRTLQTPKAGRAGKASATRARKTSAQRV